MGSVAEVKSKVDAKERKVPVFTPAHQQELSHACMPWYFDAPEGMVPSDTNNPKVWEPVLGGMKALRPSDQWHVVSRSGGWFAWGVMVDVLGATCVPVMLLERRLPAMLDPNLSTLPLGTELFRGSDMRWGVRLIADQKELVEPIHAHAKDAARQAVDHAIFRQPNPNQEK
jgi:hypothetical protein